MKIENNELVVTIKGKEKRHPLPEIEKDSIARAWAVPKAYMEGGLFVSVTARGEAEAIPACSTSEAVYLGSVEVEASPEAKLAAAKAAKLAEISKVCDLALIGVAAKYPEREILSWPQQIREAELLSEVGEGAATPLLNSIAEARGLSVTELGQRVMQKMMAYAQVSGEIFGARQAAEDAIQAAEDEAALDSIEFGIGA